MDGAVSFVVLTKNNEATIHDCIKSILKQVGIKYEIIIVDGGSSDFTVPIITELVKAANRTSFIEVTYITGGNIGESRQLGVERAKYDLIAFVDSDCELPYSTWAVSMLKGIEQPDVAGVFALGAHKKEYPAIARYTMLSFWEFSTDVPLTVTAENFFPVGCGHTILKKVVIQEVGGFKSAQSGEDVDLTYRVCAAGYSLYLQTYPVYHLHASTLKQYLSKYKRDVQNSVENSIENSKKHHVKFLLSNTVLSVPLALLGVIVDRDIAWLWHPFVGIAKVFIAGELFFKQFLNRLR